MTHNFDQSPVAALNDTIQALAPGARGAALVPLFDGKASRRQIANWRAGIRGVPLWAVELLRTKIRTESQHRIQRASQMKEGPGLKAGTNNIKQWHARKWNVANPR
jgi:hypothetical protein